MSIDEIYQRMNDDIENLDVDLSDSKIREFFAGKTIFLSGATGFVGKVFVEKILRDCPQLKQLYVIVRRNKGVDPEDIMKKYFENMIFDNLRRINPNFKSKVVTITGDLQEDKLGLSSNDRRTLVENIDIIIHSAAITKFDEKISVAMKSNVLGTKNMLDLATECKKIRAFVYVSTGYSHCYRKVIDEIFYDPPCDLDMVYNLISRDENNDLTDEALKKIVGKWPNNYTFSKAIAEGLVKQYGDKADFAVGVYRPTIILAARNEPLAGWIGNEFGPTLLFTGIGLGVLHAFYHDDTYIEDFIPVDMVINCLIAMVYDIDQQWPVKKEPVIYNYGSSTLNPISLGQMSKWFLLQGPIIGSTHLLWYPFIFSCKSYWQFWILHLLFHFIPALFVDIGRLCTGKKPKALRLFFFVTRNLDIMDYFGNSNWRIKAKKSMELYDRLNKADQTIFDFDVRALDWENMTITYTRGVRLYYLKESFDNLELARKRFFRVKTLHYIVSTVFLLMIAYLAMRLVNLIF